MSKLDALAKYADKMEVFMVAFFHVGRAAVYMELLEATKNEKGSSAMQARIALSVEMGKATMMALDKLLETGLSQEEAGMMLDAIKAELAKEGEKDLAKP